MPAVIILTNYSVNELSELKKALKQYPFIVKIGGSGDATVIVLENEGELFDRKRIESAGIEAGKDYNPSKRRRT